MKIGLSVSIDVTKILKERLYQGAKGTYLDCTTFIDTENADRYGNHGFISQSLTKEEREGGAEKTPILGNSKVFYQGESDQPREGQAAAPPAQAQAAAAPPPSFVEAPDDIPF
jgi:hypothetical protein